MPRKGNFSMEYGERERERERETSLMQQIFNQGFYTHDGICGKMHNK